LLSPNAGLRYVQLFLLAEVDWNQFRIREVETMLDWFNSRDATQVGASLADEFAPRQASEAMQSSPQDPTHRPMERLLRRADSEVRSLRLNFYKKAKFANSFKWRLIENGVAREVADEVTKTLVLHLSQNHVPAANQSLAASPSNRTDRKKAQHLFNRGNKCFADGNFPEAAALFQEAANLDDLHAEALNNLGSSFSQLGRYVEAEQCFRQAIAIKPNYSDPHGNLGILLQLKSDLLGAEVSLRRAIQLRPTYLEARINLGLTLAFLGRLRDARACFAKALKTAPRNVRALYGLGQIATFEGRFEEANTTFKRIIEIDPKMPRAWAALAATHKMTNIDVEWFNGAEKIATSGLRPMEEANLRFAMGKYCDDIGDFEQAFQNYKRGNELRKTTVEEYDQEERAELIDNLIRVYSRDAIASIEPVGSSSTKPVFVVGMPRSGTSLAEQIIASHPAAFGAGELTFWETRIQSEPGITDGILSGPARQKIAQAFLRILEERSANAQRVIDKAPVNSDFLGIIYSVFPNARVIYMQRDPIDICLSCYFQQFLTGLNFTNDLSDLAHYYREHQRITAHWRAVLPPGFILEVPYERLVADQEVWSRKMLDFIGLEWDERCLEFHTNTRQVVTASAWQVRQKIYKNSVARWRNYEKFLGPLKALKKAT
jgi:Flp pilus assembly protein TadD